MSAKVTVHLGIDSDTHNGYINLWVFAKAQAQDRPAESAVDAFRLHADLFADCGSA
jgi:hypothetical protein